MKLIVGLGNPGSRYRGTRHNVGFEVVDEVARRRELVFEPCPADAYMARERGPNAQVMLAKPCTYMNLSGEAVGALVRYYRFDLDDILVVADDVNLPLGRLRARRGGSAGGHNGLQSVISLLGTEQFARLRVGVDRGDRRRDLSSHVLAGFESDELDTIKGAIVEAGDAVEVFADSGIDMMMNRFN
ncbi:MAG: aminoacyl-tRNA hydrolase [Acidobacteria bacterium]|nr:aminoacyl-tRNA hydrolase [Acidobacteriota bacterium]